MSTYQQLEVKKFSSDWEVMTPNGWADFDGVRKTSSPDMVRLTLSDNQQLVCTQNHLLKTNDGFSFARLVVPGDILCTSNGNKIVFDVENLTALPQPVFDLLNVDKGNVYFTNNIVSHNCQFVGSSSTLIVGSKLKQLVFKPPIPLPNEQSGFSVYEMPKSSRVYFLTGDTSQGKGLDYSAFQIIDITQMPYKQVCVFRDNRVSPSDYSEIIYRTAQQYNDCMVLLETNDMGQSVCETIYNEYEYENMLFTETAGRAGKRLSSGFGRSTTKDIGLRTSKSVKAIGCSMLKLLIEQDQLVVNDLATIQELNVFSKKGNSYEAEPGNHDDLVMSLVLFAWVSNQKYFKELTDIDTLKSLREKSDEEIETDVLPFGFINTGHEIYDEDEAFSFF